MGLAPLLDAYENVILDLDGCVWVGTQPTRGAADAIAALRAGGRRLAFLTNDSRRSPEEYVRKLWGVGVRASLAEVLTAGAALQFALAGRPQRQGAFVIGSPALHRHVAEAGLRILNGSPRAERAEVVAVGGHDRLDYGELRTATRALLADAELIAADRDRVYPGEDGPQPGTGAIVAALEFATGRRASIVGKPERAMFAAALDRFGGGRTLVIGDGLDSDLAGAAALGLDGALVLSGSTSEEQARAALARAEGRPVPRAVARDLHELVLGS